MAPATIFLATFFQKLNYNDQQITARIYRLIFVAYQHILIFQDVLWLNYQGPYINADNFQTQAHISYNRKIV